MGGADDARRPVENSAQQLKMLRAVSWIESAVSGDVSWVGEPHDKKNQKVRVNRDRLRHPITGSRFRISTTAPSSADSTTTLYSLRGRDRPAHVDGLCEATGKRSN